MFSAAKLFFAYGLGNGLTFPLVSRRDDDPDGRAADAGRGVPRGCSSTADDLLRRAHAVRGDAREPRPAASRPGGDARLHVRRRGAAGGHRPALDRALRRRDPRRSRLDGDAARLPVQSSRRRPLRHDRHAGARLRAAHRRRRRPAGARRGRSANCRSADPTAAMGYWNNREKSRDTFQGRWTRSGDKYSIDADGYYVYAGRSDDMLKVAGIYVSPIEVEAALITHPAVLEAAVIGRADDDGLVKPHAYVVLKPGHSGSAGARRGAAAARQDAARAVQVSRAGSSSSTSCRRPPPARSSDSSCARAPVAIP